MPSFDHRDHLDFSARARKSNQRGGHPAWHLSPIRQRLLRCSTSGIHALVMARTRCATAARWRKTKGQEQESPAASGTFQCLSLARSCRSSASGYHRVRQVHRSPPPVLSSSPDQVGLTPFVPGNANPVCGIHGPACTRRVAGLRRAEGVAFQRAPTVKSAQTLASCPMAVLPATLAPFPRGRSSPLPATDRSDAAVRGMTRRPRVNARVACERWPAPRARRVSCRAVAPIAGHHGCRR